MNEPATRLEGAALFAHPVAGAVMAVLRERGYAAATVEDFCRRAAISPTELPAPLREKPRLVLRVSEAFAEDFARRVSAAFAAEPAWPASLRAAAYEAVRWIRRYPEAVWWGSAGVLEAGDLARARRDSVLRWGAELIDAGRDFAPDPATVPEGAPVILIGSVLETLGQQREGAMAASPAEVVPRLMYAAVRPYLGEDAARAELSIPPPPDLSGQ